MRPRLTSFVVPAAVAALVGALLGWQDYAGALLRARVARQHAALHQRARLEAEHERLVAAQVSPAELARLRAERAAVSGLVTEIEAIKRRADATPRHATRPALAVGPDATASSLGEKAVPAHLWKNTGQATPAAAFETALWAAAGGDVDALSGLLWFDARAQASAEKIFATLPAGLQQELRTPDRLIALLTAKDVPLGSAQILVQYPTAEGTKIVAQLIDSAGKAKESLFALRNEGTTWRLVVPADAVERYAVWLQASPEK